MNVLSEQTIKTATNALLWSLAQNYHLDKSNAAIHNAEVRFSPITFRIVEALGDMAEDLDWKVEALQDYWGMLNEVQQAKGAYPEDTGR
jgi:hypothetical protein